MKKFKYIASLISVFFCLTSFSQIITNVRVSQEGKTIVVLFDIDDKPGIYDLKLYYTMDDGITWQGPLKNVTGEQFGVFSSEKNKKVIWHVVAEIGQIEGNIQFKLEAEPWNIDNMLAHDELVAKPTYSPEYYKYKKSKTIWLSGALVSGGVGVFSMIQSKKFYDQYQTATTDAADLHQKVKLYDLISPLSFGVAGLCTLEFILKARKQGKAKKQSLLFTQVPLKNGAGIGLAYTF